MTTYKKLLQSQMIIRFHDCDPFNHLNNSRYIDYFMTARGDQLIENYQFDIYEITSKQGIGWVSAQTQIAYLSPALLMEKVIIQTRLLAYTEKSLLMEASMWNQDQTHLKAIMWARFVHYNLRTQTSYMHSDELMAFFKQIVNPLETELLFEEHVKKIKTTR